MSRGRKYKMKNYMKLFRVSHYLKNVLIFAPLFFSNGLLDVNKLLLLIYMTIPFCLISSVIYVINDINDVEKDRNHPVKCKRPIASGAISVKNAKICVFLLIALSSIMLISTLFLGRFQLEAVILIGIYFVINLMYSKGMKNIPIVDVVILAVGYLIRILYGASIIGVEISSWLYLTTLTGALYLGIGKRRNELRSQGGKDTRKVLNLYNYNFLDKNMYMFLGLTITFYALWAIQTAYPFMIWTVIIIIVIFMKYSLDIEGVDSEGNPMDVIKNDKTLLLLAILYALTVFAIIYLL